MPIKFVSAAIDSFSKNELWCQFSSSHKMVWWATCEYNKN